jgi:hypothetical protein
MDMFSKEFLIKIARLRDLCKQFSYAAFSFRFWHELGANFNTENGASRLRVNWRNQHEFYEMGIVSLTRHKWNRLPPSSCALHEVRTMLETRGVKNFVFMSERWKSSSVYIGDVAALKKSVGNMFESRLEKEIANMFIIANARYLCRSRDSTYNHLPILLGGKWAIDVIDT